MREERHEKVVVEVLILVFLDFNVVEVLTNLLSEVAVSILVFLDFNLRLAFGFPSFPPRFNPCFLGF